MVNVLSSSSIVGGKKKGRRKKRPQIKSNVRIAVSRHITKVCSPVVPADDSAPPLGPMMGLMKISLGFVASLLGQKSARNYRILREPLEANLPAT
jgi:hypothetical protein